MTLGVVSMGAAGPGGGQVAKWVGRLALWIEVVAVVADLEYSWVHTHIQE